MTDSVAERQRERAASAEVQCRWDAKILRRQCRPSRRIGEVIARPFSRLAYIEEQVRAK